MKRRLGLLAALVVTAGCDNCGEQLGNLVPQGSLEPAVYSFGVVRVGASCPASLTLFNRGGQELHTSGNSFTDDTSNNAFSVLSLPPLVETAGEAPLEVQYAPTTESNGLHTATLVIASDDPREGGRIRAVLTGEATSALAGKILPRCKVKSTDADEVSPCVTTEFGSTPKDSDTGITRTINVTNDGTAPFNIIAINIQPVNGATLAPEFSLDLVNNQPNPTFPIAVQPAREGDCGVPVMGSSGVPVTIVFRPTRVGIQAARVQIITDAFTTGTGENASAGQSIINVSGIGSGVGLGLTPDFIPFGSVPAGTTVEETVRVANLDVNPASVNTSCIDMNGDGECVAADDVECTGGDPDSSTGLNCDVESQGKGFVLQATDAAEGGSDEVTITVTWAPPAAVSFSKDLLLKTNIAGNRTFVVRITGGTSGRLTVDNSDLLVPASTDTTNATGMATFTLSNTGMADLIISRITLRGFPSVTDDFTVTAPGATPALAMSCTRAANEDSCMVPAWTGSLTLAPQASVPFTVAYADNDPAVAVDLMSIDIVHNGSGGSPFTVNAEVCKPAGGSSNRTPCP